MKARPNPALHSNTLLFCIYLSSHSTNGGFISSSRPHEEHGIRAVNIDSLHKFLSILFTSCHQSFVPTPPHR